MNGTVVIFEPTFNSSCPSYLKDSPFSCADALFREAFSYMKCIGVKIVDEVFISETFRYNLTNVSEIYPFPLIIPLESNVSLQYHVTTMTYYKQYKFYASPIAADFVSLRETYSFLASPYSIETWITFFLTLLISNVVRESAFHIIRSNPTEYPKSVFYLKFLELCTWATIGIFVLLYGVNLRAKANVMKFDQPFRTLDDLTELVSRGRKILIVQNTTSSYGWSVLSGSVLVDDVYSPKLKKLYDATQRHPPVPKLDMNKLDLKQICKLLQDNSDYIFISNDELSEYCPGYCFWTLPILEIPTLVEAFVFPKQSIWWKEADLCVDFFRAFRRNEIRRNSSRVVSKCNRKNIQSLIKTSSLVGPFLVWLCGALVGVLLIVVEYFLMNVRLVLTNQNTYNVHQL